MIPQGAILNNQAVFIEQQPSLTYKLDFETGHIAGKVDGLDAVKQSVYKILLTERFHYLIYSFSYGIEMDGLIGVNPALVRSELKRQIEEALLQDDRIEGIENMRISINGDEALIEFTVITRYGSFDITKEVLV